MQISELKRKIQKILGFNAKIQVLMYKNQQLFSDKKIIEFNLQVGGESTKIFLFIKIKYLN